MTWCLDVPASAGVSCMTRAAFAQERSSRMRDGRLRQFATDARRKFTAPTYLKVEPEAELHLPGSQVVGAGYGGGQEVRSWRHASDPRIGAVDGGRYRDEGLARCDEAVCVGLHGLAKSRVAKVEGFR